MRRFGQLNQLPERPSIAYGNRGAEQYAGFSADPDSHALATQLALYAFQRGEQQPQWYTAEESQYTATRQKAPNTAEPEPSGRRAACR